MVNKYDAKCVSRNLEACIAAELSCRISDAKAEAKVDAVAAPIFV